MADYANLRPFMSQQPDARMTLMPKVKDLGLLCRLAASSTQGGRS